MNMLRFVLFQRSLLLVGIVSLVAGCSQSQPAPENLTLEIDELLALPQGRQLADRVRVGAFTVCPPLGMAQDLASAPEGLPEDAKWKAWGGVNHLTVETGFVVMTVPLPEDLPTFARTTEVLKKMVEKSLPTFRRGLVVSSTAPISIIKFYGKEAVRFEFVGYTENKNLARCVATTFFNGDDMVLLGAMGGGKHCDEACRAMLRCATSLQGEELDERLGYSPEIMTLLQPRSSSAVGQLTEFIEKHEANRVVLVMYDVWGMFDYNKADIKKAFVEHVAASYEGVEVIELPSYKTDNLIAVGPVEDREDFFGQLKLGRHGVMGGVSSALVRLHLDDQFVDEVLGFREVDGFGAGDLAFDNPRRRSQSTPINTEEVVHDMQAQMFADAKRHEEEFHKMEEEALKNGGTRVEHPDGAVSVQYSKINVRSSESKSEPVAADDYAGLAKMLTTDDSFDQEKAAKQLLEVDPADVTDLAIRKQIARGFRTMAIDSPFHQDLGVQGLVKWGGKFSVPILVQLMDREKMSVDDHLFEALASLKHPDGAAAVARRLGNFFNHEKAVSSLRQMGAAAEDALIETAPSNDAKASLAAVELLGDCGTPKSYDLLRQAMKSSNREVKEAAKTALKKIREREEAAE